MKISNFFNTRAPKIAPVADQIELTTYPNRSLRLLIVCGGAYISGMEIKALDLMQGFHEHNHTIHCLVNGWNDGDFITRLQEKGISYDTVFLGKLTKSLQFEHVRWTWNTLWRWPGALWQIHCTLNSFQPDVILLFNRDAALLAAPILCRWPCVFHVADLGDLNQWNRILYGYLATWVTTWIGVSHFIGNKLKAMGIPEKEVRVVHNGVPLSVISDDIKRIPYHVPTIGICGQIGSWKGHDDLLDALIQLLANGHEFRCLIFGRGDTAYIEGLQGKAKVSGIASRIEWRGFVKNLDRMYQEIDILAIPSRFEEPFGLVAVEAGLNRIPAVVTRQGGLPEIIIEGVTGFIVEPQAPAELAARLAQLIEHPALRKQMGIAAQQHVQRCFTVEKMIKGHEQVLFEVLAGGQ